MRITFVIPDLLWPRQAVADTLGNQPLPALESLLGLSRRSAALPSPIHHWQAAFALDLANPANPWAAAPLRRLGLGHADDGRTWLCADPVHLQLSQQHAAVADPVELHLDAEEARQLHAALAPVLAELGDLSLDGPHTWHLAPHVPPPAFPESLPLGESAVALLPAGEAARPWRRRLNEAQMILHDHPVNQARAAAGKPVINSLALWGAGVAPKAGRRPWTALWSDDPMLWGLSRRANIATRNLPARFETARGAICIHYDGLVVPTRLHDAIAWREALLRLESQWLAPALAHKAVDSIELLAWGEDGGVRLMLDAWQRRKFWRRPMSLPQFITP
ncbi:hypothetical protein B9N43_03110 [Denitratisoma sp. DHT3]|uniref:hypothetical protein n=1 Tax=Denitratisoma sp. DHT3 TaxID=1981880 RepID=UPI001198BAB9|nr:hypothetical protein [Denitratisoma sp. DHT3]QDX80340.1 hypothetical protein B9N43_03110 [Denitratisoma sp. DHT3]